VRRWLMGVTICSVLGFPQVAVTAMVSTVTVTATPVTPVYGQAVVLTASLGPTPPLAGVAAPTGQVTFQDGGTPIGTGTVASGIATLSLNTFGAGSHTVTVVYGGDSNWSSSQASTTVAVSQAKTLTTVSLTDKYAMVAVVIPVAPGAGAPTGSVQFLDPRPNVGAIGRATLLGGSGSAPWPYTGVSSNGILQSPSTAICGPGTISGAGPGQPTNPAQPGRGRHRQHRDLYGGTTWGINSVQYGDCYFSVALCSGLQTVGGFQYI
jgi:hypothetical protein